jgi:hypothetical protein
MIGIGLTMGDDKDKRRRLYRISLAFQAIEMVPPGPPLMIIMSAAKEIDETDIEACERVLRKIVDFCERNNREWPDLRKVADEITARTAR